MAPVLELAEVLPALNDSECDPLSRVQPVEALAATSTHLVPSPRGVGGGNAGDLRAALEQIEEVLGDLQERAGTSSP